jgi:hypothetical protein
MEDERAELERARKEIKATGLDTADEDDESANQDTEDFPKTVEADPFVQVAAYVLKNAPINRQATAVNR